ncbi:MAG: pentapeptide repeat-containing protein [Proteobacteria bacterium]|nr:pentapeptide repeat-containing protein [Pseudomonadota bacterium]
MEGRKLLEQYANGRRDFSWATLFSANLAGADLSGANLSGANLSRALDLCTDYTDEEKLALKEFLLCWD